MDIQLFLNKAVQEIIQVGLLIADSSTGRIIYANYKLCEMFEYSRKDLVTITFSGLLWEGEDPEVWKRNSDSNVVKFKSRNGSIIWGLLSSQHLRDEAGNDIGIFYSIADITRRKIAEDRLQNSRKKLRFLSKKLIEAQEAERKRIAMELHDGVSSNITAVRLMLERKMGEVGHQDSELESITEMLRTISSDTRRISRNLHPSILEDIGLVAAFTSVIREMNSLKPDLVIRRRISIDEDKIKADVKLTLYRTLQEALNNIIKHSNADTVEIACRLADGSLRMEISDNGCGFDVDAALSNEDEEDNKEIGLGLLSMKERTEYCRGKLIIESEIGTGTRISVNIPTRQ